MKVNIPEKYADLYVKVLQEKKKILLDKINQFKDEIAEIENHLNSLTSMSLFGQSVASTTASFKVSNYNQKWSWVKKISYYQELQEKLITASEVVHFIVDQEPGCNKNKVRSSVSAALSNGLKSKVYEKFKDPVTDISYYGPASYFLRPRQPKIEYMPDDLKEQLLYNK